MLPQGSREVNRVEGRHQDRLTKTGEEPVRPKKKKPYATPRLVVYGNIAQLTSGKTPGGKPSGVGDEEEFSGAILESATA